jgi:hypothetical protein
MAQIHPFMTIAAAAIPGLSPRRRLVGYAPGLLWLALALASHVEALGSGTARKPFAEWEQPESYVTSIGRAFRAASGDPAAAARRCAVFALPADRSLCEAAASGARRERESPSVAVLDLVEIDAPRFTYATVALSAPDSATMRVAQATIAAELGRQRIPVAGPSFDLWRTGGLWPTSDRKRGTWEVGRPVDADRVDPPLVLASWEGGRALQFNALVAMRPRPGDADSANPGVAIERALHRRGYACSGAMLSWRRGVTRWGHPPAAYEWATIWTGFERLGPAP